MTDGEGKTIYHIEIKFGDEATGIHEHTTGTQETIVGKYAARIPGFACDFNIKPGEVKPVYYKSGNDAKQAGTIALYPRNAT